MTTPKSEPDELETFNHMITVLMASFRDALALENADNLDSAKVIDAFAYANSWLKEHDTEQSRKAVVEALEKLKESAMNSFQMEDWDSDPNATAVPMDVIAAELKQRGAL